MFIAEKIQNQNYKNPISMIWTGKKDINEVTVADESAAMVVSLRKYQLEGLKVLFSLFSHVDIGFLENKFMKNSWNQEIDSMLSRHSLW